MKIVRYGDWEISVDVEKTKEYYSVYEVNSTQVQRNFIKYCETMSKEEREFFDSFAIDPICCDADAFMGVSLKYGYPCSGYYLVCGKYLKTPPEIIMTVEELEANNFIDDRPDRRIKIGAFQFDFQNPEYNYSFSPDDMPEGFICINFMCERMQWLLDEPCENLMDELQERLTYNPPSPEELQELFDEMIANGAANRQAESLEINEKLFSNLNISAEIMTEKEFMEYKEEWVSHFAPADADKDRVRELCVTNGGYSTYLWHLFSFDLVCAMAGDDAIARYNETPRKECILVSHWDNLCYKIDDATALTPEVLEEFADVTLTDVDFSWTYSQTHESDFGPYFYEKP